MDRPMAGIATLMIGLFLFSLQDVAIKAFSDRYSVLQIVFIRAIVALVPIVVAVIATSGRQGLVATKPYLLLLKGLFGFASYAGYYLAIAALPLAEVVAIVFAAPIFVTVLSALILNERVSVGRWSAVLAGFVGVLIVVGPSGEIGNIAAAFAMLAALTYAGSSIMTRYIGAADCPWTISLYSMIVFLVGSALASLVIATGVAVPSDHPSFQFLLRPWIVPDTTDSIVMILLGINAAAGFYCLTKAYWIAPASLIAPFEYIYILWAVLFGFLFWSEVPALTTVAGVILLIASSLLLMRGERRARSGQSMENPPAPQRLAAQSQG